MTPTKMNEPRTTGSLAKTGSTLVAALVLVFAAAGCTPATPDTLPGTGGGTSAGSGGETGAGTGGSGTTGSGGATSAGSGGAPGTGSGGAVANSGGAVGSGSGGSTGPGTGGSSGGDSGGATASGGSTVAGSGGAMGGAGRAGTGGAPGTGGGAGGAAVLGCDWANPAGRIVLFDGTTLDQWKNLRTGGAAQWRVIGDGSMEVVPLEPPTDIQSKMKFEDLCVHIEYMTPMYPSSVGGQQRGNSGVFLKSAYEMQILDSIGQPPAIDSCGAVYSIAAPMVVACNMQLVWNTYEIEFKTSGWDAAGKKIRNAVFVNATLNGKLVQRNVDLNPANNMTQAGQPDAPGPQSLMLQDHRNLVRFRNIWVKVPRY